MGGFEKLHEVRFPPPGKTPADDTRAVIKFYRLAESFPQQVLKEAKRVSKFPGDPGKRLDLRRKFIFTCDPKSARDYDDAISLETDRRGNRVLGVHIADVSHFVRPGGALDREARRRSTSVYFCDRVLPMLPEELSNGACSLVPGEDRFAFSVFMTFDRDGRMVKRSFAKSIIRSSARFTYEQAMTVICGGTSPDVGKRAAQTLRRVSDLAQQLRSRRFRDGALDLEIPDVEVLLDRAGEMAALELRPYDESHQMIEECMVAANEAVAAELWSKGIKIPARLHEPPDEEKMLTLRAEMRGLGVRMGDISKAAVFASFLQSIKRNPLYPTIAMMILRSMKKAVYDSKTIGHFGLAKRYYAHFTSPIRRYPDLMLHRQLSRYLAGENARMPPDMLERQTRYATEREEIATEAERALIEIKKFRYLEGLLSSRSGIEFDAVISKCMPFGCFVEIPELAVSGLVHVSSLARGFVRFNESDQSLSLSKSRSWRAGDKMRVRVAGVDFRERKIDFEPVLSRFKR